MWSKLSSLPPLVKAGLAALVLLIAAALAFAFLGGIWALAVLAAGILVAVLFAALTLLLKALRKRKASDFDRQLSGSLVSKAEVDRARRDLEARWQQAMKVLREAKLSIYDLPWFLLIGEPQSGKSTTLLNSGIEFPIGREAISGVGGTRNCDWWFANEAVILDTAGRFTFQERNAPDREEWLTFLQLLRRQRPACPINGVIVVIPVTSLQEDSPEVLEEKAQNIRNKLENIQKILEIQFPVFVLVTKADHVLGFTEFCGRLPVDAQRQLFGWSETRPFDQPYNPAGFREPFEALVRRLHRWRLRFLSEETSASEADKLFTFPEEFRTLGAPLEDYLRIIFQSSRFAKPLFFRGYYVTSGMQQGRPIARACAAMLGQEGPRSAAIEALEAVFQRHRAFFIRDFYSEKLFPEQGLIFRTPEAIARDRKLRIGTWVGGALLVAGSIAFLSWGMVRYNRALEPVRATTAKVQGILTEDAPTSIPDALVAAREVSQRVEELHGTGATAAFFRGRENVVSSDLRRIHRVLFEKKVLAPLLVEAGKALAQTPPEGSPQSEHYLDALQQYIGLLALEQAPEDVRARRLAKLDVSVLASYYAAAQGQDLGLSAGDLAAEYGRFVEEGGTVPPIPAGSLDLGGALAALEAYWPVSAELAPYRALVGITSEIDRAYEALTRGEGMVGLLDYDQTKATLADLRAKIGEARAKVEAINQRGFLLSGPNSVFSKLEAEIDDGSPARRELVERLRGQSRNVADQIEKTLGAPLRAEEHLILLGSKAAGPEPPPAEIPESKKEAKKAALQAVKEAAKEAVQAVTQGGQPTKIAALTPLVIEVEKVIVDADDFFKVVDAAETELPETLTKMAGRKAEDQAKALRAHHDAVRAKRDEVVARAQVPDIPEAPPQWSGTAFKTRLPVVLDAGMRRYFELSYPQWLVVYKAFPLTEPPGDASDWRGFKSSSVFLRGQGAYQLFEPVEKLTDALRGTVPPELGQSVPEAAKFAEHLDWLDKNRKRIQSDAEAFVACGWNLDDDPVKAWQMLHDTDPKGATTFANLGVLDALEQEAGGRFPEDRVTRALGEWSVRMRRLLFSSVSSKLEDDWRTMNGAFTRQLASKFPFGGEVKAEGGEGSLKKFSLPSASLAELADFFTGRDGVGALVTRYRLSHYLDKGQELPDILSGPQKKFVALCEAWRRFLFKEDTARAQTVRVEYEPFVEGMPEAKDPIGRKFTRLSFSAPGAFEVTFRPSSDRARAKEVTWKPEAAGDHASLKIRADNEDSGDQSAYYLEAGPLSILAYVMKFGTPERGSDRKGWIVRVDVPNPENPAAMMSARVRFRFDQPVPEPPR